MSLDEYPSDPVRSAERLLAGAAVEWQPGTGCRHVVAVMTNPETGKPMLLGLSGASKATILFPRGVIVSSFDDDAPFVRKFVPEVMSLYHWLPQIPEGEWACLRPLLAALGWAQGNPKVSDRDSTEEYRMRLDREASDSSGRKVDDERLGKIVRLAVAAMPVDP